MSEIFHRLVSPTVLRGRVDKFWFSQKEDPKDLQQSIHALYSETYGLSTSIFTKRLQPNRLFLP